MSFLPLCEEGACALALWFIFIYFLAYLTEEIPAFAGMVGFVQAHSGSASTLCSGNQGSAKPQNGGVLGAAPLGEGEAEKPKALERGGDFPLLGFDFNLVLFNKKLNVGRMVLEVL
jgi:hypothetical protein